MTAESIALTNAVKYCGSGKGSQPARQGGRQGVSEPAAPLFTLSFGTNDAADRKKKYIFAFLPAAYSLGFNRILGRQQKSFGLSHKGVWQTK